MTVRRSSRGRSEQASSESSCGSIGATRPGTYTEFARSAAPRSSGDPAGTKCETSAMCTHARSPSPSVRTDSASSKSFAVSGSIVNVTRSRRSTRPSSVASGMSNGSKSPRTPSWTSRASRTFSSRFAEPMTCRTRARPRPFSTSTRSPGSALPSVLRSSVSGVPGVKYGSPTTSLPRRSISTTSCSIRR